MATNTCQSVSTPGVAVKATFQSKVWVGGLYEKDLLIVVFSIYKSCMHVYRLG